MRIALDCRNLSPLSGGVHRYASELARALSREAAVRGREWNFEALEGGDGRRRWGKYRQLFREGGGPFDLLHVPRAEGPLCRLPYRVVVTLHDLTPLSHPWTHARRNVWFHRFGVPAIARAADRVITDSEASRREILRRLSLPPERVAAVPLGVGEEFRIERPREYTADGPLLFVGTLEPRKNLPAALEAHALLRRRGVKRRLLVVGAEGWGKAAFTGEKRAGEGVEMRGWVSPKELTALYREAGALVYPSFWEGFGLPVLEAMASGTPVVCSDRGGLAETAGRAAAIVDPERPETVADALERLLSDPCAWEAASERGRAHAGRFTWRETARATWDVYEKALEDRLAHRH